MNLKNLLLTLFLGLATLTVKADNYEGYTSSIEGVGLWWLHPGDKVERSLRFGENSEFATYCDGQNSLFIYEKLAHEFKCKTESWEELVGFQNNMPWKTHNLADKRLLNKTIELAKKDKNSNAGESKYLVSLKGLKIKSQGIFTVSKEKLPLGNWVLSSPEKDVLEQSVKLASQHQKSIKRHAGYTYKSVLGFSNNKIRKLAERSKIETYTLSIRVDDTEVILIPTLYELQELGGDLISSVILKDAQGYRFIGHVQGCLLSVGADLDSDGIPEVILENCVNSEGQSIAYVKLVPKIKSLITYSHN